MLLNCISRVYIWIKRHSPFCFHLKKQGSFKKKSREDTMYENKKNNEDRRPSRSTPHPAPGCSIFGRRPLWL